MQITNIPQNYASLRSPLVYTITDTVPRTFDIKIIEIHSDEVVGVKRLTGVSRASVDIAPYLRRRLFFKPQSGSTGFISASGRTVFTTIEIDGQQAERRTFVPTTTEIKPPMMLSTMPASRLIGRNECDEITLCTATPAKVWVTGYKNGAIDERSYTAAFSGFALFRINIAEFPGAEFIHLRSNAGQTIIYHVTDFGTQGHRLAWRSSTGSIEHYTFPIVKENGETVTKEQLLTDEEYHPISIRKRRTTTLLSAYEPRKILIPLTEILASPKVWSIENGIYTPVQVANTASGLRIHGTLRNLEVQILHTPQTLLP